MERVLNYKLFFIRQYGRSLWVIPMRDQTTYFAAGIFLGVYSTPARQTRFILEICRRIFY